MGRPRAAVFVRGFAGLIKINAKGRCSDQSRANIGRQDLRGRMSPRFWVRLWLFSAAAIMPWPLPADADPSHLFVVIVPPARRPSPPPAPNFPPQAPLQWAPHPSQGLTPGRRSPTARCYAGAYVCPLTRPEHVGQPCTCGTPSGTLQGRALIPPSRDISGRPLPNG